MDVLLDAARRVRSVDREEIASNNKVCGFINNFKYVFYVPLNFGLGDFFICYGGKRNRGFCEKVWKIIIFATLVRCVNCESEAVRKMSKCDVITKVCEALSNG